jgi:hypothetical protein
MATVSLTAEDCADCGGDIARQDAGLRSGTTGLPLSYERFFGFLQAPALSNISRKTSWMRTPIHASSYPAVGISH